MEEEDINERELVMKAIVAARDAYQKVFEDENIDSSYFPLLKIIAGRTDSSLQSLLWYIEDNDLSTTTKDLLALTKQVN